MVIKLKQGMAPERILAICDLADSIGECYQSPKGTDLDKILNDNGIRLFYEEFEESFDGLLDVHSDQISVYCNLKTGNHPGGTRTRFTIAHELGHYFIDEHRIALRKGLVPSLGEYSQEDLVVEREADLFASRLLMPGDTYQKVAKKAGAGLHGIINLSKHFNVSVKSSAIRYMSEDFVSCALSFWSWDGDLVWKWFSKSMWDAGIRKFKTKPINKGATDLCIKASSESPGKTETTAASIGYIFQVTDGVYLNEIIQEEAMVLGEFGVLSLISAQRGKLPPMAEVLDRRFV